MNQQPLHNQSCLLDTIRCPSNLQMIGNILPQAQYVRPLISRREKRTRKLSSVSESRVKLVSVHQVGRVKNTSHSIDRPFDPKRLEILKKRFEARARVQSTRIKRLPVPSQRSNESPPLPPCLNRVVSSYSRGRGLSAEKSRPKAYRSPLVNHNILGLPRIVRQMPQCNMQRKLDSLEMYNKESRLKNYQMRIQNQVHRIKRSPSGF